MLNGTDFLNPLNLQLSAAWIENILQEDVAVHVIQSFEDRSVELN